MRTVYVDVYFLINFTVDLLGLHFASKFTKVPVSVPRMLIGAILGGFYAVVMIFIPENPILFTALSLVMLYGSVFICAHGCGSLRKFKFTVAFLIFEILIGGLVYFSYGALERVFGGLELEEGGTDRRLLILSLIILLSVGVLKLFLSMFRNTAAEKSVRLKIVLFDKEYETEAFVDSGNLAKDPMDLSPVMLMNKKLAKKIFPEGIPDISKVEKVSEGLRKRLRIIPISSASGQSVLFGVRPDSVFVVRHEGCEKINLTIAFDKEGGSYGGFDALIPSSALDNI